MFDNLVHVLSVWCSCPVRVVRAPGSRSRGFVWVAEGVGLTGSCWRGSVGAAKGVKGRGLGGLGYGSSALSEKAVTIYSSVYK